MPRPPPARRSLSGGSHRLFPLCRGPRRRRATLFWSPTLASTDRLRWPPSRVISSPPARRRPPSPGRRAARARPSACPPPGRPPPSPSALAAARRSPPPRCVHRATTRADRDPRPLSPASIARRLPTRVVLPNPRSRGSDARVPLAPHACPPVAIAVDLTRPSPRAIPSTGCRARPARRARRGDHHHRRRRRHRPRRRSRHPHLLRHPGSLPADKPPHSGPLSRLPRPNIPPASRPLTPVPLIRPRQQEERDKERLEEIRELNRATLKATGEQMSEQEIEELRPSRYLDRREFKDDD